MIAYFDTSAIVPLLIEEPTSRVCLRLWTEADDIVTVRVTYVETAAALAAACRLKRMTSDQLTDRLEQLAGLWAQFRFLDIDQALVSRAAELARVLALRGYDAVHAAAGELLHGDETVAVAGDRQLLAAWSALGLSTVDTNTS